MPHNNNFNNEPIMVEPQDLRCMRIKVPVVLAEEEAQVVVDTTFCLPELAKKIDHIDVSVQNLEADPVFVHETESTWNMSISKKWPHMAHFMPSGRAFVKKVIVHGTLHKQIFYVNMDDAVKHVGEDIPFTKTIDLAEPEPVMDIDDVEIQFHGSRADVTWDLVRASRLQQTGVIIIRLKVSEQRQIFVAVCPFEPCPTNRNLLRDPSFEQWIGDTPLLWGATNVFRASGELARTGTFAAGLGLDPTLPAAVFQTTRRINPDFLYRLCFWARKLTPLPPNCDFTLEAQVTFFDADHNQIDVQSQSWSDDQVPTAYKQFCLDVGPANGDIAYALVRIAMQVPVGTTPPNNCQVIIDDATLLCIRRR
ncbi:MAG: DUF3794 domain-containing protein [Actinobacteria bacterium]|nr:DUF3794 domain-containing protein [Actinomycetota bacterium]